MNELKTLDPLFFFFFFLLEKLQTEIPANPHKVIYSQRLQNTLIEKYCFMIRYLVLDQLYFIGQGNPRASQVYSHQLKSSFRARFYLFCMKYRSSYVALNKFSNRPVTHQPRSNVTNISFLKREQYIFFEIVTTQSSYFCHSAIILSWINSLLTISILLPTTQRINWAH